RWGPTDGGHGPRFRHVAPVRPPHEIAGHRIDLLRRLPRPRRGPLAGSPDTSGCPPRSLRSERPRAPARRSALPAAGVPESGGLATRRSGRGAPGRQSQPDRTAPARPGAQFAHIAVYRLADLVPPGTLDSPRPLAQWPGLSRRAAPARHQPAARELDRPRGGL